MPKLLSKEAYYPELCMSRCPADMPIDLPDACIGSDGSERQTRVASCAGAVVLETARGNIVIQCPLKPDAQDSL